MQRKPSLYPRGCSAVSPTGPGFAFCELLISHHPQRNSMNQNLKFNDRKKINESLQFTCGEILGTMVMYCIALLPSTHVHTRSLQFLAKGFSYLLLSLPSLITLLPYPPFTSHRLSWRLARS